MTTEAATTPINFTTMFLPSGKAAVPADAGAPSEAELQARLEPHQAPRQEAHHHQAEAMEARTYPPPYRFCERNYTRLMIASELVRPTYHEVYHMERSSPPNHQVQREPMSVNSTGVYEEIEASVDSGAGVTIILSEMCTHYRYERPQIRAPVQRTERHQDTQYQRWGLESLMRKPHAHRAAV